jgi:succinoglycan biosynthesis protein ExoA
MSHSDPKTAVEPPSPPEAEFLETRPSRAELGEPRSFAPSGRVRRGPPGEMLARWPAAWDEIPAERFIRLPAGDVARKAAPRAAVAAEPAQDRALIVIPCLNEAGAIARVIGQVLADDRLVDPLVLVADGGSTDGTRAIVAEIAARDRRVRLTDNPGRLQSAGVNLAARLMGEDRPWLVRVDAHADYPPRYASTLIAEAKASGAASVVVAMDTRGDGVFQRATAAAQNSRLGTGGAAHRIGGRGGWVDHGHHALFRLSAFAAAGGYDETFSHNEDAEFDLRLRGGGGAIWLTDKVRIGYHPRATPGALAKQYFSYGKGRARTVLKHRARPALRQALPLAVAPALLLALLAPLAWPLALPALGWAGLTLAFGLALAIRAPDPAVALAGPAAMIMHAAWSAGFWRQVLAQALARRVEVPESRFGLAPAE